MYYQFEAGQSDEKPLILLHGTGGDEESLLPIAKFLAPKASILSFRGRVQEQGMNRFFKRKGLGVYDYESLEAETDHLYEEIVRISAEQNIPLTDWILMGYSNGANIGAHLLLERETPLRFGLFFHATTLGKHTQDFPLTDKKVWLSFGDHDPIVSDEEFSELLTSFQERDAQVSITNAETGHQLSQEEIMAAGDWLGNL